MRHRPEDLQDLFVCVTASTASPPALLAAPSAPGPLVIVNAVPAPAAADTQALSQQKAGSAAAGWILARLAAVELRDGNLLAAMAHLRQLAEATPVGSGEQCSSGATRLIRALFRG